MKATQYIGWKIVDGIEHPAGALVLAYIKEVGVQTVIIKNTERNGKIETAAAKDSEALKVQ